MKTIKAFVTLSALLLCFIALGQPDAAGSYTISDCSISDSKDAPKGYKPVYFSAYIRHGARFLVSENYYLRVITPLEKAHSENLLSDKGEILYLKASGFYYNSAVDRAGDLSGKGWEQQKALARKVVGAFPSIFRKGSQVTAISTLYPRCIMSMNAFCQGLKEVNPSFDIQEDASKAYLARLNPRDRLMSDSDTIKPVNYNWDVPVMTFLGDRLDADGIVGQLFKDGDFSGVIEDPVKYAYYLYHFIYGLQCVEPVPSMSESELFTPEEASVLWEASNLDTFHSPGLYFRSYKSVADGIVDDAKSDLLMDKPVIRLRFGHDTAILGLMTLLDIDGFGRKPSSIDELPEIWQDYRTPMAASMFFVIFKNRQGNLLLKLLVDGQPATLPLKSVESGYYEWKDFEALVKEAGNN